MVGPPMSMFSISSSAVQTLLRCGRFERIQIHHHQVDGRDAVLCSLLLILRMLAAIQQATVDLWMQCFHAAAEHLRPSCKVRHVAHGDSSFAQKF